MAEVLSSTKDTLGFSAMVLETVEAEMRVHLQDGRPLDWHQLGPLVEQLAEARRRLTAAAIAENNRERRQ